MVMSGRRRMDGSREARADEGTAEGGLRAFGLRQQEHACMLKQPCSAGWQREHAWTLDEA